jgi:glucose-6-phosphate isomerase
MYRDVRVRIDDEKIKEAGLRYDLTVVLPRMLGTEFNKTYGHYHPKKDGTDVTYPEVYEVISGMALCLLQKMGKNEDELDEIYLVEVKSGEKIIMPPNFGHITINPLSVPLVMSNWVAAEFSSEYELYEKNHGGGYYITKSQINSQPKADRPMAENLQIVKNRHYKKLPKLIKGRPKELKQFALDFGKPLYSSGSKNIGKLNFLVYPEKFGNAISPQSVFVFE